MKKQIILTVLLFAFALVTGWSQTEAPKANEPKDKTAKMKKAEEKSDGAAFSGKGKRGKKDQVEKGKKGKGKAKGQGKGKGKGKKKGQSDTDDTIEGQERGQQQRGGASSTPQGEQTPAPPAPPTTEPEKPAKPKKPQTDPRKVEPKPKSGGR